MHTDETPCRHARLFALIHQQARAEYTALRLVRRSKRPLAEPTTARLLTQAARSWSDPAQSGQRG
ncbi:hypothetical protein [Antarcticimicrobium luteum]|uniref:Uncharacterized protein n=1 Tax=Antarcticimicrobium luteum TaxID=2547397 RepID=A0A4R5V028_9RHOB|nr:hypothetical protein [Antarcticimicrobium luteum]TDK45052.1 hypothetical protein E1832_14355 [Antarcticimicrobium luteum]